MKTNARVYVMSGRDGLVKVGHARNTAARLKQIEDAEVILFQTDVKEQAEIIERTAHRLLRMSGKGVRGEWFRASLDEAVEAILRAERIANGEELDLARKPSAKYPPPFSIRLEPELKAELQRLAQADRRSLTNLVEIILEDYVAANSRKGKAA